MAFSKIPHQPASPVEGAVYVTEDYAASEVPQSAQRSTLSVTLVRMGYTVSATDLLFGMSLGLYFYFWTALTIALVSSIAICVVSILTGLIGQREGLTTALVTRLAFGREGSRIPALVIAIVALGFVGYSTAITASVLPGDSHGIKLTYIIVLSAVYTVLSTVGFGKGLTWVGRVSVPLMVVVVLIAAGASVNTAGGWNAILTADPAAINTATTISGTLTRPTHVRPL